MNKLLTTILTTLIMTVTITANSYGEGLTDEHIANITIETAKLGWDYYYGNGSVKEHSKALNSIVAMVTAYDSSVASPGEWRAILYFYWETGRKCAEDGYPKSAIRAYLYQALTSTDN